MNEEQAVKIGSRPQMFLDDYIIEEMRGLERSLGTPAKFEQPVLRPEMPWEAGRIVYPEPVLLEDGVLMYYNAAHEHWVLDGPKPADFDGMISLCMALSSDGLHWIRPELTDYTGETFGASNIVYSFWDQPRLGRLSGVSVYLDKKEADEARRYKMFYNRGNTSTFEPETDREGPSVAWSLDGMHWTPSETNPVLGGFNSDTKQCLVRDRRGKRWIAFIRRWETPRDGRPGWPWYGGRIRVVARTESEDFVHWSEPEVVLRREADDPANCDFYGLQVRSHNGLLLGWLWTADWAEQSADGREPGVHGPMRAQLVISRDWGRTWTRVSRRPFLDVGAEGAFDAGQVYPAPMVTVQDMHFIYYGASTGEHRAEESDCSIGLATVPRDRFAGLTTVEPEAELLTRPLVMPRGDLHVNVAADDGELTAEVLDAEGKSLRGTARSKPVRGDHLQAPVEWEKGNAPDGLAGQPVRIRFRLRDATLYQFSFRL